MLALLLAALGGCHMPAGAESDRQGAALVGAGPQLHGTLGFPNVRPGQRYRFSYPLLKNHSKETVEFTGLRLLHVPGGVKVLGYNVYSDLETDGVLSDKYGTVLLEVTGRVRHHLTGCRVEYKQQGVAYHQDFHCEFALDSAE
ncbi:hypothetical protein ABZX97_14885 [Streptomyces seoulensis]|uniref:hypothetical protein n=1 Tax=Streptomyces seoulensis TaxID=73044 RepID=UPI0033AE97F4